MRASVDTKAVELQAIPRGVVEHGRISALLRERGDRRCLALKARLAARSALD